MPESAGQAVGCSEPEQGAGVLPPVASCRTSALQATRAKKATMNIVKVVAVILIVLGIAGLAYGKFSYTEESHNINVGPIDFSVKEKKTVNVPMWVGIGAILAGALLLIVPGRK
jgi:uncharacterized membrane protein YidH (DUF202 family)